MVVCRHQKPLYWNFSFLATKFQFFLLFLDTILRIFENFVVFLVPRSQNKRSWLYRIRPSVVHKPFKPFVRPHGLDSYVVNDWNNTAPNPNQVDFNNIIFRDRFNLIQQSNQKINLNLALSKLEIIFNLQKSKLICTDS